MASYFFRKRHTKIGAAPGTLVIPKASPAPRITSISYNADAHRSSAVNQVAELAEAFRQTDVTWIDIQGFGDRTVMRDIGTMFGLHPLLLEDVVNLPQRPKVEAYGDQLLIVVRMVRVGDDDEYGDATVDMEQVSVVVAQHYVITFQEKYGDILDPVRKRVASTKGVIRERGADYLALRLWIRSSTPTIPC